MVKRAKLAAKKARKLLEVSRDPTCSHSAAAASGDDRRQQDRNRVAAGLLLTAAHCNLAQP